MKPTFIRMLLTAIVFGLGVGLLVALVGRLFGWSVPAQYSAALFAAGAILIVLGLLSIFGGYATRTNLDELESQPATATDFAARSQRWVAEMTQGYGALVFLLLAGVALLLMALLAGV